MPRWLIVSWNVNGVRAAGRQGFLGWLAASGADVVALQEIKARPEQLPDELRSPAGYSAIWHPADRPGYSGVATLARQAPAAAVTGLGDPRFDHEGRTLVCDFPGFRLYNVYIPSGSSGPERVAHKLAYSAALLERLREELAAGRSLVVCGDLNTAFAPIDLARPRENQRTSGFLPEERAALGEYFAAGLVDSFRHLHPRLVKYSWWSLRAGSRQRNVGWRLDYLLVSSDLAPRIVAADTHPEVAGSDHCPVSLALDL